MKEIGGYFELEDFVHNEYYPDLIKLNLGRTALLYLLERLNCRKLLLPYYLCDSVTECCRKAGYHLEFYRVDKNLAPLVEAPLEKGTYLYLVNYYGQLTDEGILSCRQKYGRIIVDHTHSFFQRPLEGVPTIYSCRKFFGLPDGAYLSADLEGEPMPERDVSGGRMAHILGRYEGKASDYYTIMLENAGRFHQEPVRSMSKLTENLLNAIDYERVRRRRNENYGRLEQELGQENRLGFHRPDGPLAYPFYCRDAQQVRRLLAAEKIYVPVYWANVIAEQPEDSLEYDYAAHILPLPCDQRYTPEDMSRMAAELRKCLASL